MEYKMYTREEYLQWCKKHNVKNPLPEYYEPNELVKLLFEKGYRKYPLSYDGDEWYCYIQMAMKWLRKKYNIIIVLKPATFSGDNCTSWAFELWCGDNYDGEMCAFKTYEEAVEAALKYCLENLI